MRGSSEEDPEHNKEILSESENADDAPDNTDNILESDEDLNNIDQTFCARMKSLATNKTYILLVSSITMLYYIITGIQYWASDYMIRIMKKEKTVVFVWFGILSITSPVLGVVVGGKIVTCLGGYTTKKAVKMTVIIAFFCFLSGLPLPVTDNFALFLVFLWILMFLGGAILPSLTGIMLNTVPQNQRTTANSIAYLVYNCLGYLPSPFIYGAITDMGSGGNDRFAMGALIYLSIIPLMS